MLQRLSVAGAMRPMPSELRPTCSTPRELRVLSEVLWKPLTSTACT